MDVLTMAITYAYRYESQNKCTSGASIFAEVEVDELQFIKY